jgi:UDP-N-acetylglucosamine 4,6-dehydratase
MKSILTNKRILITGGTGSIGESLVKRAITDNAKSIKIFSNDENGLYELESLLGKHKNIDFIIGDIRDENTIKNITKKIDIIFHAAALKHVDRCELYPAEAFSVNVLGTQNVVKSAIEQNVKRVISISTDKAVNPIGVMGATKLLGEKLLSAEAFHKNSSTIFASVRFGNVFHTRGSILPKIENQIKQGGPITLTDKKMKRFFMTKNDAVSLILKATEIARGGEIFVLKMPLLKLDDLFESMKTLLAPKYGFTPSKIKTKITGVRPGEKFTEYLLSSFEMEHVIETKNFYIIPSMFKKISPSNYLKAKKSKNLQSYFETLKPINQNEILKILKTMY